MSTYRPLFATGPGAELAGLPLRQTQAEIDTFVEQARAQSEVPPAPKPDTVYERDPGAELAEGLAYQDKDLRTDPTRLDATVQQMRETIEGQAEEITALRKVGVDWLRFCTDHLEWQAEGVPSYEWAAVRLGEVIRAAALKAAHEATEAALRQTAPAEPTLDRSESQVPQRGAGARKGGKRHA